MSTLKTNTIQAATGTTVNVTSGQTFKANTIAGTTTAGSVLVQGEGTATTNLQQGLCKVWYNISSDFATINDSFNIGSITDNATGEHKGNFTNNMSSEHYGALADHHNKNNDGAGMRFGQAHDTDTNGVVVHTGVNSGNTIVFEEDGAYTQPVVHVMGDLA